MTDATQMIPRNGIIVLMDSLGTRGITASQHPQTVLDTWLFLLDQLEESAQKFRAVFPELDIEITTFSDTVMISANYPEEAMLVDIIGDILAAPFYYAFADHIFLRGIICAGFYYQDPTRIIGPAIDEAAEWYENSDWIGLAASPSMEMLLNYLDALGERIEDESTAPAVSEWFVQYEVPWKNGVRRQNTWAFAWPLYATRLYEEEARVEILRTFKTHPASIGIASAAKYTHTIAFVDHVLGKDT